MRGWEDSDEPEMADRHFPGEPMMKPRRSTLTFQLMLGVSLSGLGFASSGCPAFLPNRLDNCVLRAATPMEGDAIGLVENDTQPLTIEQGQTLDLDLYCRYVCGSEEGCTSDGAVRRVYVDTVNPLMGQTLVSKIDWDFEAKLPEITWPAQPDILMDSGGSHRVVRHLPFGYLENEAGNLTLRAATDAPVGAAVEVVVSIASIEPRTGAKELFEGEFEILLSVVPATPPRPPGAWIQVRQTEIDDTDQIVKIGYDSGASPASSLTLAFAGETHTDTDLTDTDPGSCANCTAITALAVLAVGPGCTAAEFGQTEIDGCVSVTLARQPDDTNLDARLAVADALASTAHSVPRLGVVPPEIAFITLSVEGPGQIDFADTSCGLPDVTQTSVQCSSNVSLVDGEAVVALALSYAVEDVGAPPLALETLVCTDVSGGQVVLSLTDTTVANASMTVVGDTNCVARFESLNPAGCNAPEPIDPGRPPGFLAVGSESGSEPYGVAQDPNAAILVIPAHDVATPRQSGRQDGQAGVCTGTELPITSGALGFSLSALAPGASVDVGVDAAAFAAYVDDQNNQYIYPGSPQWYGHIDRVEFLVQPNTAQFPRMTNPAQPIGTTGTFEQQTYPVSFKRDALDQPGVCVNLENKDGCMLECVAVDDGACVGGLATPQFNSETTCAALPGCSWIPGPAPAGAPGPSLWQWQTTPPEVTPSTTEPTIVYVRIFDRCGQERLYSVHVGLDEHAAPTNAADELACVAF